MKELPKDLAVAKAKSLLTLFAFSRVIVHRRIRGVKVIRRGWYVRYGRKYRRAVLRKGRFIVKYHKKWVRIRRRAPRRIPRRVIKRRKRRRYRRRRRKMLLRKRRRRRLRLRRRAARRKRRRRRRRIRRRRWRRRVRRLRKRLRRIRIKNRSRPRRTRLRVHWLKTWHRVVRRGKRYFIRVRRKYLRVLFRKAVPFVHYKKRWIRRPGKKFG